MKPTARVCKVLEELRARVAYPEWLQRVDVVREAYDWVGTPFIWQQHVKGPQGGADCGTFLIGVYHNAQIFDVDPSELKRADGERIGPGWNQNQEDEVYLKFALRHAQEIILRHMRPAEEVLPGDLALVKMGKCWAHGGVVVAWPQIIHNAGMQGVLPVNAETHPMWIGQERRFFSPVGRAPMMKGSQSQQPNTYNGAIYGQTVYGDAVPTVIGVTRIPPLLIWAANHRVNQSTKKYKKAKKKGGAPAYAENADFLLGSVPINEVGQVWVNKALYGLPNNGVELISNDVVVSNVSVGPPGQDVATITNLPGGHTALCPIAVLIEVPYSVAFNEYGSPYIRSASGSTWLPFFRRENMVPPLFQGLTAAGWALFPYPWVYSWGGVSTTPFVNIWTGSLGTLAGSTVRIWYEYCPSSKIPLSKLHMEFEPTLASGSEYSPSWTADALDYLDVAGIGSSELDLGNADAIPTLGFEVTGHLQYSQYGEANIADVFFWIFGQGAPAIQLNSFQTLLSVQDSMARSAGVTVPLADLTDLRNFTQANDIFVAMYMETQQAGTQWIQDLLDISNSVMFWSGFQFKIVPRSEVSQVGNGVIYTPPCAAGPLANFTPAQFIVKKGDPPLFIGRVTVLNAPNQIPIEHKDGLNQYNKTVTQEQDQLDINRRGAWLDDVHTLHEINRISVAQSVASMMVQRSVYQRRTFTFTLDQTNILYEPMDLITVADPTQGLEQTPCRITKQTEGSDWTLQIEAEEFIYGINAPNVQPSAATSNNPVYTNAFPPSVTDQAIFELPAALRTSAAGLELGIVCCSPDPSWGGAAVFVSNDNSEYITAGFCPNTQTMGVLIPDYPLVADPDTVDTLEVNLAESDGALTAATTAQQNQFASLVWLSDAAAGEFIAYGAATLVGGDVWDLAPPIRRGVYGSTVSDHPTGSQFVLVDATILKFVVPQQWIGQTLYFKFCSVNTYQTNQQEQSAVSPVTFVPTGASLPPVNYTINPQAPVTQPTPTSIVIAPFTAAFPTGPVSYLGKTVSITAPVTTQQYWVTIQDPGQVGEGGGNPPLTYFVDTNATRANSVGFTFAGTIVAIAAGGAVGTAGGSAGPR